MQEECVLIETTGKYFYGDETNRFIEIQAWEYRRILSYPYRRYFTTALKKHLEWLRAVQQETTMTFSRVLGA